MAPPVSRYPPQNLSNPFAHLNQQPLHQSSHLQHQNPSIQAHNLGGHHGFGAANQNGLSLFGPQSTNGNIPGSFGGAGGGLGAGGAANGLASQAAQMGFAHGGNLQLQQAQEAAASVASRGANQRIREVWKNNIQQEMATIRHLVDRYPYISMDTEFPGIVARPIADDFGSKAAYHYQTLRCNVDLLKIIQLGITLFTVDGEVPPATELQSVSRNGLGNNLVPCPCTWTFNFRFNLEDEMWNEDSIALLRKAGTDFDKHAALGIDVQEFGSLLITSGLTFSNDVYWISFHSGYDFGYLTKLMWCRPLPNDEEKYRKLVKKFFPNLYDVKFMLRHAQKLRDRGTVTGQVATVLQSIGQKSSLQDIAEELGCARVGIQHTAGSDAWLTGNVFWEMRKRVFDSQIPEELNGQMWGLTGVGPPASAAAHAAVLAAQNQAAAAANGMMSNSQFHQPPSQTTRDGGPSTPTTHPAGLASTPSQGYQGSNMTPGGGGVFGNFQSFSPTTPGYGSPHPPQFSGRPTFWPTANVNHYHHHPNLGRSFNSTPQYTVASQPIPPLVGHTFQGAHHNRHSRSYESSPLRHMYQPSYSHPVLNTASTPGFYPLQSDPLQCCAPCPNVSIPHRRQPSCPN